MLKQEKKTLYCFAEETFAEMEEKRTENGWIFSTKEYPNLKDELGGFAQRKKMLEQY